MSVRITCITKTNRSSLMSASKALARMPTVPAGSALSSRQSSISKPELIPTTFRWV
jgi:hypothetical protein